MTMPEAASAPPSAVDAADARGCSAFYLACVRGDVAYARQLLARGADVHSVTIIGTTPVTPLGGLVFTAPPRVGEHKLPTNCVLRSISGLSLTDTDQVHPFDDGEPEELKLEDCLEAASGPPTRSTSRRGSTFSFGTDDSSGLSGITESAV